jgi:hypothetical protein
MSGMRHSVVGATMAVRNGLRTIELGLVGGLVGTFLMDAVMIATFLLVGEKADVFFSAVGEKLGGGALIGVAVHMCIGTTGGFIFSLLVINFKALDISSIRRGAMLGFAAGAITVPLGCIPLAIWLGQPILGVIAFSILPHLVWGTFTGWTVARGTISLSARTRPVPI